MDERVIAERDRPTPLDKTVSSRRVGRCKLDKTHAKTTTDSGLNHTYIPHRTLIKTNEKYERLAQHVRSSSGS